MKRAYLGLPLVLIAVALGARSNPAASAQDSLARRLGSAPDGTVGFTFPARAGVCGDGRTFISERNSEPHGYSTYVSRGVSFSGWQGADMRTSCVEGPVRVILHVRGGNLTEVQPYVGGTRGLLPARTELGAVGVAEAVGYLLTIARLDEEIASRAVLAAHLGDGARITPTLFGYARDGSLDAGVREVALRFIGRAAAREGTLQQSVIVARDIAVGSGAVEVRERALRVLADELGEIALVRSLYDRLDDAQLRERAVRSVGDHGTADDRRWLRTIAERNDELESVRERAIRILGDLGQSVELRQMFERLNDTALRERIIRVIADNGTREDLAWLEQIVVSGTTDSDLRERAVRSLHDAGANSQKLASLYDRAGDEQVRERIIRMLAERGDDAATDKLIDIIESTRDQRLRERAIRSLAELRNEKARKYLESKLR